MTTPAINTPYSIVVDAMQDAGLLQDGDVPTPEQLAKGLRRLRDLILLWTTGAAGLKLWLLRDTTVTLTAGTAAYTLFPGGSVDMTKPLRVNQGFYLYTASNVRRALTPLSYQEYYTLGQSGILTANQGTISQYYVEKLQDRLQVTFWLCPNTTEAANGAVHLVLRVQATQLTELDETVQFPDEWRIALHWGLADDLCTGQPQAIMDRCQMKAELYKNALEGWDVEDADTSIQVDMRGYRTGAFT